MAPEQRVTALRFCDGMLARTIGDGVRFARESLCWSQKRAADRLGICETHLQQIEAGMRLPNLDVYLKLLGVYELGADELLGWRAADTSSTMRRSIITTQAVPRAVGMAVQRARQALSISREHAAARLSLSTVQFKRVEQGEICPDLLLFAHLVEEFDLCADEILRQRP